MALDPFSAAAGKAAVGAVARPALGQLRIQIARRGAEFADLSQLSGADKELDEALAVLHGEAESLPNTILLRLKGMVSQRPAAFADADARHFIGDDRVIALVKSGARKTIANSDIPDERAGARAIHAELFGDDGVFGERLLEDAIAFSVVTLLAHLAPADRLVIEIFQENHAELLHELHQISDQISGLKRDDPREPPNVDPLVLDAAVAGEVRRLRRQRFVYGKDLVTRAEVLGQRLENGLGLATPAGKATAFREIAVVFSRAERPDEAEAWIERAAALGADVDLERARVALAKGQTDDAMRLLRDRSDVVGRSLLIDTIQRRDGEAAALAFFEGNFTAADLTGHALQAMAVRLANAGRDGEAEALLAQASAAQIDENPVLLYIRARMQIGGALPADVAERFAKSDGMIPHPTDLRDDEAGNRRLAAARVDLWELQRALADLDAPDLAALVDINLLFLNLSIGDAAERERGREALATRLGDPDQAIELAPLASIYGIEIDWSMVRARLDQAEQLGGYDDTQLRAAFALVMKGDSPNEIATFIQKYRGRLREHQGEETVTALEVEALAKIGDAAGAKAVLAEGRDALSNETASFLDATIAEAEGADSIGVRLAQYESSGSSHDLQILVGVLGRAGDERLGDYLIRLWESRHQVEDARRACDALISAGRDLRAEAFLEALGDLAREDPHLRTHLAWSRQRQGRLLEAADELNSLGQAGVDDINTRQLTIILAVETGRWAELEPFVQKELAAQEQRSAAELMSAAGIAHALDSSTTMPLVRAAVAKAPDDPVLNLNAYTLAVGAGNDRTAEANAWLARAIAGSGEEGPVFAKDYDDVVAMVKESRAQSDRVSDLVTSAQVPLFLALQGMRGTQSALVLRQLPEAAEEIDSRRKVVMPLYAGNRLPSGPSDPKSIAFDPMALLVLDYLGLLRRTLAAFDDVVLPAGTLHSFFEDRGKSGPSQPSRIIQAREIKDRAASGMLTVETLAAPDPEHAAAVGDEFARLYGAAVARDGYVVDTAPLHPPGELKQIVDPARFADRLLSPVGLVRALHAAGILSQSRAKSATALVAGSGEPWGAEPEPVAGKPMFLTNLAVQYLSDAGLLPILKAHAGSLVVLPEVTGFADQEIAGGKASAEIRQGIERVREALADAITEGRARIGPTRLGRDATDGDEEEKQLRRNMGPVMSALRDSGGVEAMVCDDRAMNKYLQFTDRTGREVPLLTTTDVLAILHAKGALTEPELAAARESLRLGGVGLMPLDPEELVQAAKDSNWAVGPNAELRAIRDSIHLPLARRVIQLPQERPWFKSISIDLGFAIRRVWQEIEDISLAERAATYLLDLIPDPEIWSADDESPDRAFWVQDVSRHTLWAIASIFDLPEDRTKAYQTWFEGQVRPNAERRDPGAIDAVARTLFSFLNTPLPDEVHHGEA
ncbi:MAG: hypothetical protein QOD42_1111 [Sphingomonadales bacterium]|jgi:hypothetical protein|nr:hypothetical protein [Sphingomonadales bacterium]